MLRLGVIYGANAAGKSNFIKALQLLKFLVVKGTKPGARTGVEAFRLNNDAASSPTEFEIRILCGDSIYTLGCVLNKDVVIRDFLYRDDGKSESLLYERVTSNDGVVSVELGGGVKPADAVVAKKLRALGELGCRANQLFIAEIAQQDRDVRSEFFHPIVDWFDEKLQIIGPDTTYNALIEYLCEDGEFIPFASSFLRRADTGIKDVVVERTVISEDQLSKYVDDDEVDEARDDLNKGMTIIISTSRGDDVSLVKTESGSIEVKKFHFRHESGGGALFDFSLADESDGTQRLMNLLPALHSAKDGYVFIVDELDRSLHPIMVKEFLAAFVSRSDRKGGGQMLVTTHETHILDQDLVRRDEIWFVEKNKLGESIYYPLTDFEIRHDLKLDKGYINGRFGAIPFAGATVSLSALINKNHETAASD